MAFSVAEILSITGGALANGESLGNRRERIHVSRPAPLGGAGPDEIAFFFSREFQGELPHCRAGVLVTAPPFVKPLEAAGLPLWSSAAVIACEDPYYAMAVLSEKLAGGTSTVAHLEAPVGGERHPTAVIDPSAEVHPTARIGAYCVIEKGATIGAGTVLYPGCFVGPGVRIGSGCVLFPQVTVYEWVQIGDRVRLHAGARLGADGFGYAPKRSGREVTGHQKIYHLGRVVIGNEVEIGANSCVDRGTFGDTIIANKAKLDNVVHVGHNARVDEGAVLCGGVCLAGSASVGKYAYIGGMTGIANKVHVGDGAQVGALALLTKDVPPGGTAVGNPQREYREHFKAHALLNKLISERKRKSD